MLTNYLARYFSLLLLTAIVTFTSCSKDDDISATQIPEIYNYRIAYMAYPQSVMPNKTQPKNIVNLEYDAKGRVVKRWGNLMPVNWSTGYDYYLSEGIFDEVTYDGDKITITKGDTLKNLNVHPDRKFITMEYGKLVNIIRETTTYTTSYDTTWLYYNHNTLFRTVNKDRHFILTKDFFYDENGNLSEIKGLTINRHTNETNNFQLETFSDYDNANNPIKDLGIFDELFYRSLSRNNFRKYTMQRFSPDSILSATENRSWQFKYGSKGKVKFDE